MLSNEKIAATIRCNFFILVRIKTQHLCDATDCFYINMTCARWTTGTCEIVFSQIQYLDPVLAVSKNPSVSIKPLVLFGLNVQPSLLLLQKRRRYCHSSKLNSQQTLYPYQCIRGDASHVYDNCVPSTHSHSSSKF